MNTILKLGLKAIKNKLGNKGQLESKIIKFKKEINFFMKVSHKKKLKAFKLMIYSEPNANSILFKILQKLFKYSDKNKNKANYKLLSSRID